MNPIEQIANEYADKRLISCQHKRTVYDASAKEFTHSDLIYSFLAGAEWQRNQDRWRDVDEELPEENTTVLIKTLDSLCTGIYSTEKECHHIGWYYFSEADITFMIYDVTHWKPITM